jgi:3-phosphoglycerate kinase
MENMALKKIIDKKKKEGKTISPIHKEARSNVLEDLMDHLGDMGMDKINGLKKVTVAANTKEDLAKGLNKATEMVQKGPMGAMEDEDVSDHGANEVEESEEESPEHEASEDSESEDDIKQKIEELQAKLKSMKV